MIKTPSRLTTSVLVTISFANDVKKYRNLITWLWCGAMHATGFAFLCCLLTFACSECTAHEKYLKQYDEK